MKTEMDHSAAFGRNEILNLKIEIRNSKCFRICARREEFER
jgi:hypothetical protein